MLRISTTTIDLYNRFLRDDKETEEKLLRKLRNEELPNKNMLLGSAFHNILEDPHKYFDEKAMCFVYDGIVFPFEVITKCYDEIDYDFPFEVKTEKVYNVNGEDVVVVAVVDQLKGILAQEYKSTWSGFDIDRYTHSVQWKFYQDIFQIDQVEYIVFCLYESANDGIILKSIERFTCDRYPELQDDIQSILAQFVDYIHFRELEPYFQPKEKQPALDMDEKAFASIPMEVNNPALKGVAAMIGVNML